ncbi:MAG: hypothetical protein A2741_02480 [Candidatus Zambryskibacteria bacterium RIFCSPHIGHO2_01_FULL_43_27]|nr:MAG: hypothetical protein A2741_02480 [Candidatus Zambryskibacteria bacterium RIFCSPHIGHO2_01_FULL_43_27]
MYSLSSKKRLWYRISLAVIFVIAAPLLILYASGYRLDDAFRLASTGGIYISAPQSGVEIYVDNELIRKTSAFQKNAFVQNLKPADYEIRVTKEDYQEWSKILSVFPETVTEAHSFLLRKEPVLVEVRSLVSAETDGDRATSTATTSIKQIKNPEYDIAIKLFEPIKTSTLKKATSTDIEKVSRKLSVLRDGDILRVTWLGNMDDIPGYFCRNEICKEEIIINPNSKIRHFDFFPGREDLIIMSLENGIYVSEIDDRSKQNVQKIVEGGGYDFRILEGDQIYIKKARQIFVLNQA